VREKAEVTRAKVALEGSRMEARSEGLCQGCPVPPGKGGRAREPWA